jgi:uncharacterized surface anchored protein
LNGPDLPGLTGAQAGYGSFVNYRGAARLLKTSEGNEPLAGAEFTLLDEGTHTPLSVAVSGADGVVSFTGLAPGTYSVVESTAPEGYVRNTEPIASFTIPAEENGEAGVVRINGGEPYHNYKASAQLFKRDPAGNPLTGAGFTLYESGSNVEIGSYTTDSNGVIAVEELRPGAYYFIETRIPDGYTLPKGVDADTRHEFTVLTAATDQPESVSVNVVNVKQPAAPPTPPTPTTPVKPNTPTTPDTPDTPGTPPSGSPSGTGDPSNITPVIIMLSLSGAGIAIAAILLARARKQRNKGKALS